MPILRWLAILSLGTVASRILGFGRELVLAGQYGVSSIVDVYLSALAAPSVLFAPVEALISTGLIPLFSRVMNEPHSHPDDLNRVASNVLVALMFGAGFLTLAAILAVPLLAKLIAPGFSGHLAITIKEQMRIALLVIPIWTFSSWAEAFLQAKGQFRYSATAPSIGNLVMILWLVLVGAGANPWALVVGFCLTAGTSLSVLMIGLVNKGGFRFQPGGLFQDSRLRRLGQRMIPVLLGQLISQVNLVVDRMAASLLPAGNMALINYAQRLSNLPSGIAVSVVGTAIYPALSTYASLSQTEKTKSTVYRSLLLIQSVLSPVVVTVAVLAIPLTGVAFQHGAFTPEDSVATGVVLQAYSVTILTLVWRVVLEKGFYSLQSTAFPMWAAAFSLVLHIGLNFTLPAYMGARGLAVAAAIASVVRVAILLGLAQRTIGLPTTGWRTFWGAVFRGLGSSGIMALSMGAALWIFPFHLTASWIERAISIAVVSGLGAVVYAVAGAALRIEGFTEVIQVVRHRVGLRASGMKSAG